MSDKESKFVFGKKNYIAIAVGFALVVVGFMLMSGGKSPDPKLFNKDEIFSFRRVTFAPFTVLLGFFVVGLGIMIKPKDEEVGSTSPEKYEKKDETVIDD